MNYHYSIYIQWSQEDNKFIAHLPEFGFFRTYHVKSTSKMPI